MSNQFGLSFSLLDLNCKLTELSAMGASTVWLLLPLLLVEDSLVVAVLMAFAMVGALVRDLRGNESKIKHVSVKGIKPLVPIARAINRDLDRRGLLHSL